MCVYICVYTQCVCIYMCRHTHTYIDVVEVRTCTVVNMCAMACIWRS